MSVRVLIIPEDFRKDQFVLKPLIQRMLKEIGVRARVGMCWEPLLAGIGEAMKWDRIKEIIDDRRNMVDLFLLIVDRDCKETRRIKRDNLEKKANEFLAGAGCLIAENAWQEIEVWVLAGMTDLPSSWKWKDVQAECNPKETYFDPYARERGVLFAAGEGRDPLGRQAAANYKRIRSLCQGDVAILEKRIRTAVVSGQCP